MCFNLCVLYILLIYVVSFSPHRIISISMVFLNKYLLSSPDLKVFWFYHALYFAWECCKYKMKVVVV